MDISADNFVTVVIEGSKVKPILVDFWAPWCSPCKQLTPILEKIVNSYKDDINLVKVNVDENQSIAGQLQIQSLPTVYAFFNGEVVDGFQGNIPESKLKEFVEKISKMVGPSEEVSEIINSIKLEIENKDWNKSLELSKKLLQVDNDNIEGVIFLLKSLSGLKKFSDAEKFINSLNDKMKENDLIQNTIKDFQISKKAFAASGKLSSLYESVKKNPDDLELNLELSIALFGNGEIKKSYDLLLSSIQKNPDWNDQAARKQLIEFIKISGINSDEAKIARRQLSSIIFT